MTSLFMPARFGRPTIFCRSVPVRTAAVPSVSADAAPDVTIAASQCSSAAMRSPTLVVELVEHHVVLGSVFDRLHDFRRHQRGGHGRVGAGRVDEGTDAQLRKVVASGLRRSGGRSGRSLRRGLRPAGTPTRSRENVFGSTWVTSRDAPRDYERSAPAALPSGRLSAGRRELDRASALATAYGSSLRESAESADDFKQDSTRQSLRPAVAGSPDISP